MEYGPGRGSAPDDSRPAEGSSVELPFRLATVVILGVAVIVGIAAGRSQSFSATAGPTVPPAPTATIVPPPGGVDIVPNASGDPPGRYSPSSLTIRLGEKVTWINMNSVVDTVTADNGAFNSDVISPGQHFSWTPRAAGTYSYGSYLYPGARGEIVVRP